MAKKEKKPMSDTTKKAIKISVIFVLIIGILAGGIAVLNANSAKATSKLIIACMPKTISGKDNGRQVDFYIEYNKDYNPKKDEPIKAFLVYYFDDNGDRKDLPNGHYISPTADMQVTVGFFVKAQEKLNILKNLIYVIMALLSLAFCAFLIFLWYKSWVRREEKKKNYYLQDFAKKDKE